MVQALAAQQENLHRAHVIANSVLMGRACVRHLSHSVWQRSWCARIEARGLKVMMRIWGEASSCFRTVVCVFVCFSFITSPLRVTAAKHEATLIRSHEGLP